MTLATRCPHCHTAFRLVRDHLLLSGGWVRCGRCGEPFDGAAHRFEVEVVAPQAGAAGAPVAQPAGPLAADPTAGNASAAPASRSFFAPDPAPAADRSTAQAPTSEAPAVEAPAVEAPAVEAPTVEAPTVEAPAVEAPTVEAPAVEAPAAEAAAFEMPALEAPAFDAPAFDAPAFEAPAWEAPAVEQPVAEDLAAAPAAAEHEQWLDDLGAFHELELVDAGPAAAAPEAFEPVDSAQAPPAAEDPASSASPPADVDEAGRERIEPSFEPAFLRQARRRERWQRPWARALLGALAGLLVVGAGAQAAWIWRDGLAARWPALRPALSRLCALGGCTLMPPRRPQDLVIDGSSMAPGADSTLQLSVSLRNRGDTPVAYPWLQLSLGGGDGSGRVLVRKAIAPDDYLRALGLRGPAVDARLSQGLPAHARVHLHLQFGLRGHTPGSYTVALFYR